MLKSSKIIFCIDFFRTFTTIISTTNYERQPEQDAFDCLTEGTY